MLPASFRLPAIYALLGLVALIFAPGSAEIVRLWTDVADFSAYTHGFLVAALSLALTFRERHTIAALPLAPSIAGFCAFLLCAGAWLFFWRLPLHDAYVSLMPVLCWLAVYAAFGWPIARALAFPVGYLLFAVSAWDILRVPLQFLTLLMMRPLLPLTGIDYQIDGALVHVPGGVFEVARACSGLHFMIVGLALAALLGELNRDSLRMRVRLLALMGGLALLANWLRVAIVIAVGGNTEMQHPLVAHHYYFGWEVFAVALALFLVIARWMPGPPARDTQGSASL